MSADREIGAQFPSVVSFSASIVEPVHSADGVKVWACWLDQSREFAEEMRGLLSADEVTRAERMNTSRERARFQVGRGMLRLMLSRVTDRSPELLSFRYGPTGKPALDGPGVPDSVQFNVSHSHGLALIAIGGPYEVGVDLEFAAGTVPFEHIVRRYFSAGERMALDALPLWERREAFFRSWTRKEALLKARGEGISQRLREIDVAPVRPKVPPSQSRKELPVRPSARPPVRSSAWIVEDVVPVPPGYVAAVAVLHERVDRE